MNESTSPAVGQRAGALGCGRHLVPGQTRMNAALIKPFLVATQRVFEKMLECPCRIGKPAVARGLDVPADSVWAVIQVSGSYDGYMAITMPPDIADVAATLLDVPEGADAALRQTEGLNIVARLMKSALRRAMPAGEMTFKVASDGQSTGVALRSQGIWLTAPMIGRFGNFSFALSLRPVANAQPTAAGVLVA